jgi:hypothetical protein
MFSVGSDGHGGTDVTMTATEPVTLAEAMQVPPPHVFIAAMAGLASASGGAVHLGTHIDLERPFLLAPRSQLD